LVLAQAVDQITTSTVGTSVVTTQVGVHYDSQESKQRLELLTSAGVAAAETLAPTHKTVVQEHASLGIGAKHGTLRKN
jgi:hypothetical protein